MKRILFLLLGVSLATNGWLLWSRGQQRVAAPAREPALASTKPPASAAASSTLVSSVVALESAGPEALVGTLRATGAEESVVRAMFEGLLRRRHQEKLAAVRAERARSAWWRAGQTVQAGDAALLKEMVTAPLERLFGRNPLDVADAESRYSFLSPEKRRQLAQIDLDYAEMLARMPQIPVGSQTPAEVREQRLLADERRKDIVAALTPDERAEYDLRFSGTAGIVGNRAKTMVATEADYRAFKPVMDDFNERSNALPRGANFPVAAYEELQRDAASQLVEKLGYDRTLEYLWSGYASFYGPLRRAADSGQLAADSPGKVMELAFDTGRRAAAVHEDATLNLDQKRAALVALQQTVRAQLDALLPAEVRRGLPADALRWWSELGAGRYAFMQPSLLSSGGYIGVSLAFPPLKRKDTSAIPVRPPGK
jgi:hypothetical protein